MDNFSINSAPPTDLGANPFLLGGNPLGDTGKPILAVLTNFATAVRALYAKPGSEVPFHNLDHGNNIYQFAAWYSEKMGFGYQDALILQLSAIAHDVMHPGTMCPVNAKEVVEGHFVSAVREQFKLRKNGLGMYDLEKFASEVWGMLKKGGVKTSHMTIAFGLHWWPFNKDKVNPLDKHGNPLDKHVPSLLLERAPQEVMHAWVTAKLLERTEHHVDIRPDAKAKVLMNILMTSIKLEMMLAFRNAGKEHAEDMCEDVFFKTFQCGLLLHLLDMGWCTQQKCVDDGYCTQIETDPSFVFGPRFLAESRTYMKGFNKETHTVATLNAQEAGFVGQVKSLVQILYDASTKEGNQLNIMNQDMLSKLLASADKHQQNVQTEDFQRAVAKHAITYELPPAWWMVDPSLVPPAS